MVVVEEANKRDSWEAMIHGGGPKVGRVHWAIEDYKAAKRKGDWEGMFQSADDLYMEVDAYLTEDERKNVFPLFLELHKSAELIRKGVKVDDFYGQCRLLMSKTWRVLARLNLDMAPKETKHYLSGAV